MALTTLTKIGKGITSLFKAKGATHARLLEDRFSDIINVKDYGASGNGIEDDTSSFNAAVERLSNGGTLCIPSGTYLLNNIRIPYSNIKVIGYGMPTLIQKEEITTPPSQRLLIFFKGTDSSTDRVENISIEGIIFKRINRDTYTSSADTIQFIHLLSFIRPKNILVNNCHFIGFQGDGVSMSGYQTTSIPENVIISNCYFDGVDWQNRNAISMITCRNVKIINNTFSRVSNKWQPASIDIEPNPHPNGVTEDILIHGNTFREASGHGGAIVVYNPAPLGGGSFARVKITDNNIHYSGGSSNATGSGIAIHVPYFSADSADIILSGNNIKNTVGRGIYIAGQFNGVTVSDNIVRCAVENWIGWSSLRGSVYNYNISITGNTIESLNNRHCLQLTTVLGAIIDGNKFRLKGEVSTVIVIGADSDNKQNQSVIITNNDFSTYSNTVPYLQGYGAWEGRTCVIACNTGFIRNGGIPAWITDLAQANKISFSSTTIPQSFPIGSGSTILSTAPTGLPTGSGILSFYRYNEAQKATYEEWIPYASADTTNLKYRRYANTPTSWYKWVLVKGDIIG